MYVGLRNQLKNNRQKPTGCAFVIVDFMSQKVRKDYRSGAC